MTPVDTLASKGGDFTTLERLSPAAPAITFVETVGDGSMDVCASELARRLPVPKLTTDVYARAAQARNRGVLSPPALRALGHETAFVRQLREVGGPVHLPNQHLGRYALFAGVPFVITVHDVIRYLDQVRDEPLIHRPNARDRLVLGMDYRAIARAEAVIVVSAATRRDVIEHLGISPERAFVVHNGLDHERFRPAGRRPLEEPYVLYVGSEQPRKNLGTLLRAMRRLKEARDGDGVKLVKVGGAGGCEAPFRERTEQLVDELGLREDMVFAGRVDEDELPAWYSHAECLVLPSLYEGFGNPPLEAMACGCPVVVSDIPALVEVVDDAALAVPATDDARLARTISRLLADRGLRAALRRRGLERARLFTWDRAAELTLGVYEAVAARPTIALAG